MVTPEVSHTAAVVLEDDEDVQDLEADCGDGEEVDRDEVLGVIGEEGPPGRGWWLGSANAVFLHGRLLNVDAELAKFTCDARRTPRGARARHLTDQVLDLLRNGRPTNLSRAAQPRPMVSETSALPGDHCPWLHEDESLSPTRPRSGEPGPKEAIRRAKLRPVPSPFVNCELVAQSEHFDVRRPARPDTEMTLATTATRTARMAAPYPCQSAHSTPSGPGRIAIVIVSGFQGDGVFGTNRSQTFSFVSTSGNQTS